MIMNMKVVGILVVTLWTVSMPAYAAVSNTTCTDGGPECGNIQNSACDKASNPLKCKCNDGYTEKADKCVYAVSDTVCTDGGKQCDIIQNSACDKSSNPLKCKCNDGYTEKIDECKQVYGSDCTNNASCPVSLHFVCIKRKCSCNTGFGPRNNLCVKTVSGTGCSADGSECDSIDNSSCDTKATPPKCKCNDGYAENVDKCDKGSGAGSVKAVMSMVFGSVLVFLVQSAM